MRRTPCRFLSKRPKHLADGACINKGCGCQQKLTLPAFACEHPSPVTRATHPEPTDAHCQLCLDYVAKAAKAI